MLLLKFCLLLIFSFCFWTNSFSQTVSNIKDGSTTVKKRTVLSVILNGHSTFYFNAPGDPLKFNNYNSKDSTFTKILMLDKPMHLWHSTIHVQDMNDRTKDVSERTDLIILPGDSIVLDSNGHSIASFC